MKCSNCQNEQQSGKFCEKCGTPFDEKTTAAEVHRQQEQVAATQAPSQNGVQNAQNFLQNYWSEFVTILKNPTQSFKRSDQQLVSGIISLVLLAIFVTLGFYFWINGIYKEAISSPFSLASSEAPSSLPFFELFFKGIFGVILFLAVGLAGAIVPLLLSQKSIKATTLITHYGLLSIPFVALGVLTMLIGLIGSGLFPVVMMLATIGLLIISAPITLITYHLTKQNETGQTVYASTAGLVITVLFAYLIVDNYVSSFLEGIDGIV
uniref:zinc ribbon domain-containing protein n=1 Tax=uncultured Allobacillus sp. TaxID=1638025 RepID=UPI0025969727|nr:zinc ribbon domain-containing protein [uncultured Allobacillus sp.]